MTSEAGWTDESRLAGAPEIAGDETPGEQQRFQSATFRSSAGRRPFVQC
jgi:hypothetical protein